MATNSNQNSVSNYFYLRSSIVLTFSMAAYRVYQLCHGELCFRDCKHKDADQLAHRHILVSTIFILTFSYDVAISDSGLHDFIKSDMITHLIL